MSKESDEWGTPIDLFRKLNDIFQFDMDVAASDSNHLLPKYITQRENALAPGARWGERNWCNPPYSKQLPWVVKAHHERQINGALTVMLLKADTSTRYFAQLWHSRADIWFLEHRLKFKGAPQVANFPNLIAIFKPLAPHEQYYERTIKTVSFRP